MDEPCDKNECASHPLNIKRIADLEKKTTKNCGDIQTLKVQVVHIDYIKQSLAEIKTAHHEAIEEIRGSYKLALEQAKKAVQDRLGLLEKIVYAIFAVIILGGFAQLVLTVKT